MTEGKTMTKIEFESKRMDAAIQYGVKASKELAIETGKNKRANAQKRFNTARQLIMDWTVNGFWNEKNTNAYETIYKSWPSDATVSPQ
jgi:hypothetical protein